MGRPLSELFLTVVKVDTDSNNDFKDTYWKNLTNKSIDDGKIQDTSLRDRFWTKISAGFLTENDTSVKYNVRSISADGYEQTHFNGIDESDNEFVGDIVEYNEEELVERTLESIQHRINTVYREYRKGIVNLSSTDGISSGVESLCLSGVFSFLNLSQSSILISDIFILLSSFCIVEYSINKVFPSFAGDTSYT